MLHLTDPELGALLAAGGQGAGAATRAAAHVAVCGKCAERVRAARQVDADVGRLLHALDAPMPAGRAATWQADALLLAHARRRRVGHGPPWARAAAAAVLFAATGVAAALPGSPVRTAVGWAIAGLRPPRPVPARATTTPVAPVSPGARMPARQAAQGDADAVAVTPGPAPFEVRFRATQPTGTITLVLGGRQLVVRATKGAAAPAARRAGASAPATSPPAASAAGASAPGVSYTVSEALIDVDNTGATSSYEIHVPESLPVLHVRAAGHVVFTKRGPEVVTTARREGAGRFTARFTTLPVTTLPGRMP